jgi:hypothetical protein
MCLLLEKVMNSWNFMTHWTFYPLVQGTFSQGQGVKLNTNLYQTTNSRMRELTLMLLNDILSIAEIAWRRFKWEYDLEMSAGKALNEDGCSLFQGTVPTLSRGDCWISSDNIASSLVESNQIPPSWRGTLIRSLECMRAGRLASFEGGVGWTYLLFDHRPPWLYK